MGIGVSLILIAIGAILAWAVNYHVTGIDLNVVGGILMVVGVIGLLLSLAFWSTVVPWARRDTHIVDDVYPPRDRIGHDHLP